MDSSRAVEGDVVVTTGAGGALARGSAQPPAAATARTVASTGRIGSDDTPSGGAAFLDAHLRGSRWRWYDNEWGYANQMVREALAIVA